MKIIVTSILIVMCFRVEAQQDPIYAQYINNPFILNPAYAGLTNNLNLSVSFRNQWTGIEGSPKTLNANGHIALIENKMGAGIIVISDQIGTSTVNEVLGAYSYRISLAKDKILSFGLQAGFANYKIDNTKATPFDKTDPFFQGVVSETKPSFGFGVVLKGDNFFLGLSVPRMLKTTFETQGLQSSLYTQHYYMMGSYLFFMSEKVRFKPSTLLKYVNNAPLSVDLNASFIFNEDYQVGLLTRNFNTYGAFLQLVIKDSFRLGYVYELPSGSTSGINFSTHEITLGYQINALRFHNNSGLLNF